MPRTGTSAIDETTVSWVDICNRQRSVDSGVRPHLSEEHTATAETESGNDRSVSPAVPGHPLLNRSDTAPTRFANVCCAHIRVVP